MNKVDLHLDWGTYEAAKYAVEHWHYSRRMPASKSFKIGVWECGQFVGCLMFGMGAGNATRGERYGLAEKYEVAELTRVALTSHSSPVSRMISISIKLLKKENPGLRLLISFADTEQGHHGGIYQASGWIYTGSVILSETVIYGKRVHNRSVHSRYGSGGQRISWLREHIDSKAHTVKTPPKHRYLYPLDAEMRERIASLAKPYPKRVGSIDSDASDIQLDQGGASPTSTLQEIGAA